MMTLSPAARAALVIGCLLCAAGAAHAQGTSASKYFNQPPEWFRGDEAKRITQVVLSYQAPDGGWPKNTDTAGKPFDGDRSKLRGTFDNKATTDELRFLARVATHAEDAASRDAFMRGLKHILGAQYANGGWPQYSPPGNDYSRYITFNDGSMARLMFFLREVATDDALYGFVDGAERQACTSAWDKGVECILNCQVKVDGKLTVWCAQHDEKTYEPKPARTFEPLSLSGSETIGLVHVLMAVEKPTPRIIEAVDATYAYLDAVKIPGIKVEDRPQEGTPRGYERFVVKDPSAPPMWARFYELRTNKPIFCDRDGVVKYDLSEIGIERRTGYKWLGYFPKNFLEKEYPEWKAKVSGTAAGKGQPAS